MRSSSISTSVFVSTFLYSTILFYLLFVFFYHDRQNIFKEARRCMMSKTNGLDDETLWARFPYLVNKCSIMDYFNVHPFANTDELKYHILPISNKLLENCSIVSLGIGKDVEAEKSLKEVLPHCSFYGADPVNETNAEIFPQVGNFFNIAVGHANGSQRSYILQDIYRYQEVKVTDLTTFLRSYANIKMVDQIMIDIEHAEYPLLPFFLKGGELDKAGIVICQMNIEIHRASSQHIPLFAHFFHSIMMDQQWTFLSASTVIGHRRVYMINNANPECSKRYFSPDGSSIN